LIRKGLLALFYAWITAGGMLRSTRILAVFSVDRSCFWFRAFLQEGGALMSAGEKKQRLTAALLNPL